MRTPLPPRTQSGHAACSAVAGSRRCPAGGRFAASRHTDPGTDLLERNDPAAERELFDRFSASARHWGNRLGVDAEDLLQDTAVEFYATLARQRGAGDPNRG